GSAASTPISATRRAMPGRWSRRAHDVRAVYASPHEGGSREQADSANSPLAVRHFYGDRHRQFRRHGPGCPPAWVVYSPLPPLFLMLVTGLYMFALPYLPKWRPGA